MNRGKQIGGVMKLEVGLALYSLMAELKEDYMGTLERVAEMGFKYIEYVGTPKDDQGKVVATPEAIGKKVAELGLIPISSHVMMDVDSDIDQLIADNVLMGSQAIVLPFISMESEERIQAIASLCNNVGRKCKENGMDFYYHNHFHEFASIGNITALERLLELTDPELVYVELDTYWVKRAGLDPIEVIKKLDSRCKRIHQKDLNINASKENLVDFLVEPALMPAIFGVFQTKTKPDDIVGLGEGSLDISGICEVTQALDYAQFIIIELDCISTLTEKDHYQQRTPLQLVASSFANLIETLERINA